MEKILFIISFICMVTFHCEVWAFDREKEDLDELELAAFLITNKNYSRASAVLSAIKNPHEVIPERFFALKGLLELKQKRFGEALNAFILAEKEGMRNVDIYEGMAEAYLGLGKYRKGLDILSKNKKVLEGRLRYFQLKSDLLFKNDNAQMAWDILSLAIKKFPKELSLMKQKWFYLMENKLFEVSFEVAKNIMDSYSITALDSARMGQKYREHNQLDKAIILGEIAKMKDSTNEEITKDLVRSYLKVGNITASAKLFTELSKHHPKFLVEASQLWRKAGHFLRAENLAMKIRDPLVNLKQNITLALLNEDYNKMTLLGQRGQRTELKKNEDIQYALAYAHFMTGDYKNTQKYLNYIHREDLFKKALALRQAIDRCENEVALCF